MTVLEQHQQLFYKLVELNQTAHSLGVQIDLRPAMLELRNDINMLMALEIAASEELAQ